MNAEVFRILLIIFGLLSITIWLGLYYLVTKRGVKNTRAAPSARHGEVATDGEALDYHLSPRDQDELHTADTVIGNEVNASQSSRVPLRSINSQTAIRQEPIPIDDGLANTNRHDLVMLYVSAVAAPFAGDQVLALLNQRGLKLGNYDFYHRHVTVNGTLRQVYSLTNALEPGLLNNDFCSQTTTCLALFFNADASYNPLKAFHEMLDTADTIAKTFIGIVQDEDHNSLTKQSVEHLQESIIENQRLREQRQ